ncbi:MAG TPA: MBG domain-containing protein [Candidatus Acidoferrum sp.]|nr:MBG domain-containing protein [Candidatus Acidoferrum sp.]
MRRLSLLLVAVFCAWVPAFGQVPSAGVNSPKTGDQKSNTRIVEAYNKLPLSFEVNEGQTSSQVKFLARGSGYGLFLTQDGAALSLRGPRQEKDDKKVFQRSNLLLPEAKELWRQTPQAPGAPSSILSMRVVGANPNAEIVGAEELPGKSNYFIGKDSKNWHTDVPTFAKVRYREVYPGVDLVYYGNQGQLEYDFVVAPGANPRKIRLEVTGTAETTSNNESPDSEHFLRIDENGDLVVSTEGGEVRYEKPVVYQTSNGTHTAKSEQRDLVEARYVLKSENEVGFEIGSYDATKTLIIDPVLVYSTYLTGNFYDQAIAVAVDSSGSAYVTGYTTSSVPTFPTTPGAYKTTCGTDSVCNYTQPNGQSGDAFVTKFSADGTSLVYSTYLGGSYDDVGQAIAVDSMGRAYVTGYTRSSDFPTTSGAFQTTCAPYVTSPGAPPGCPVFHLSNCGGGGSDGRFSSNNLVNIFVTRLTQDGSNLDYSTFLGGTGNSNATGIAVNASFEAYIAGSTDSQQQTGYTESGGCPIGYANGYPTTASGYMAAPPLSGTAWPSFTPSAVFSKLSGDGKSLLYSTYFGSGVGTNYVNGANAVAVDSSGAAYLVGFTNSPTFPTTAGAFQPMIAGPNPSPYCGNRGPCQDAFIAKFDPTQSGAASLVYSTFLGGSGEDAALGVALDSSGNAYVTGSTGFNSTPASDFPTTPGAFQSACPAPCNATKGFVTKLNSTGSAEVYSSFLGGASTDGNTAIALDSAGRAYITGSTNSTNFPNKNAVQSPPPAGAENAFVSVFKADGSDLDFSTFLGGNAYTFGAGIALDSSANIYVAGQTLDQNFPTTTGAFQTTCAHCGINGSNRAAFVTKISALPTNTTSPLTITADNQNRMYGAANPTFTFTPTGLLNGDTLASLGVSVTCSTTATSSSPVGSYPITCAGPAAASNYTITYPQGSLTITTAALIIAANNANRMYGAANPAFASTPSGLLNGDTLASIGVSVTCSTTATAGSPVGSYPITCAGPSSTANYTITYQPGSLNITSAPLSITANNANRGYAVANPVFSFTVSGLLNGDTLASIGVSVTCSTTATAGSPVGSYPITCSGPASSTNYAISYQAGTLTITIASLTIAANNAAKILNAPNPAFSATYSGFVNGDTPASLTGTLSCTSTATTTSPIGSYPITCSGQSSANYTITYAAGTLKIVFASSGTVDGNPGHQILQPINADGTSVYKQGRTVPAQFRVGDANGVSIGTPGVVTSFFLTEIITGTVATPVDNIVDTNNPDTAFRWDAPDQQWIFNITTKNLSAGSTYVYTITLSDGSTISFQFGLR